MRIFLILFALLGVLMKTKFALELWDKYTKTRVEHLHPKVREDVKAVIRELQQFGIYIRITKDGHFRENSYQAGLYEKFLAGGPLAAAPGLSFHEYGLAVDIVEIKNGRPVWDNPNWPKIASVFRNYGFQWGYDLWKKDKPHFQKTFGYTTAELKKLVENGNIVNDKYPNIV